MKNHSTQDLESENEWSDGEGMSEMDLEVEESDGEFEEVSFEEPQGAQMDSQENGAGNTYIGSELLSSRLTTWEASIRNAAYQDLGL